MCVEQGEGEGKREEGEGDGEKDDAPVKCWSRCQDRLSLVPEPPDEAKETGRKEGRSETRSYQSGRLSAELRFRETGSRQNSTVVMRQI